MVAGILEDDHTGLVREVAVKLPRRDVPGASTDLFHEQVLWTALDPHPNLLGVIEARWLDGEPSLVMPYEHGASLSELVLRDCLAPAEVLDVLQQILDGLEALHRVGIVHGDVLPPNVFFDGLGRVRLADLSSATSRARGRVDRSGCRILVEREGPGRDWWQAGVCGLAMATGLHPVSGTESVLTVVEAGRESEIAVRDWLDDLSDHPAVPLVQALLSGDTGTVRAARVRVSETTAGQVARQQRQAVLRGRGASVRAVDAELDEACRTLRRPSALNVRGVGALREWLRSGAEASRMHAVEDFQSSLERYEGDSRVVGALLALHPDGRPIPGAVLARCLVAETRALGVAGGFPRVRRLQQLIERSEDGRGVANAEAAVRVFLSSVRSERVRLEERATSRTYWTRRLRRRFAPGLGS